MQTCQDRSARALRILLLCGLRTAKAESVHGLKRGLLLLDVLLDQLRLEVEADFLEPDFKPPESVSVKYVSSILK
jgi:hypothetical protein